MAKSPTSHDPEEDDTARPCGSVIRQSRMRGECAPRAGRLYVVVADAPMSPVEIGAPFQRWDQT